MDYYRVVLGMQTRTIPSPFTIPEDYYRQFILRETDKIDFTMTFANGVIKVESGGAQSGGVVQNVCLDWISECVAEVRKELGV